MKGNNPILEKIFFDKDSGELSYKGIRYLLIRPETLVTLYRELLGRFGEEVDKAFLKAGFTGGRLSAEKFREIFSLNEEEILQHMARMGAEIGWGHFRVLHFDLKEEGFAVSVLNSPFAGYFGPSSRPVCHMIRGVLGGIAHGIFENPGPCEETLCLAKGDGECRFEVQPLDRKGFNYLDED